jgi:hypothetical protein
MNYQVNQDTEHLNVLSICHYVLSGLCLVPLCYGIFYIIIGVFFGAVMTGSNMPHRPGDPSPEAVGAMFGGFFIVIGLVIAAIALTVGILLLKSGRNLSKRQSYTFCFVVACISCALIPLGTILGVFTIITLTRESVKATFEGQGYRQIGNQPPNWQ